MSYKVNEELVVIYQAPAAETGIGASLKYNVYDEAHALDAAKSGTSMTEMGATGRYYATFTPDAVGVWVVQVQKDPDPGGKTVATARYDVRTLDEDDMLQQSGILSDATPFPGGNIDAAISSRAPASEYDTEMARLDAVVSSRAPGGEYNTEMAHLDQDVSVTESNIRGTDSDDLKTISDQIDGIGVPAQAM